MVVSEIICNFATLLGINCRHGNANVLILSDVGAIDMCKGVWPRQCRNERFGSGSENIVKKNNQVIYLI